MKHIPRGQNFYVDSLAMLATSLGSSLPQVIIVEDMDSSSLTRVSLIGVYSLHVGASWMNHIVTFLKQGSLPEDKCEVEKVRINAPRYWLSEEKKLYKSSYSGPYLFCVHPKQWSPCWKSYIKAYMGAI